jgi:hypothetical protein
MTLEIAPHIRLSSSAQAEDPVRRDFSIQSPTPLEYWITRLRGGRRLSMRRHSRDALCAFARIAFTATMHANQHKEKQKWIWA